METTIDYGSDYDSPAYEKWCPLMDLARVVAIGASGGRAQVLAGTVQCKGPRCAWWDAMAERCAVLSLARSAAKLANI